MKITAPLFLAFYCFSTSLAAVQDDDFWLFLTPPAESSLRLNSSTDSQQQLLFGLQVDQKINTQLHLNFAWSQYDINQNIRSTSLGFSGDPYNNWLWFYRFNRWGESGLIETRDHEFRLQYYAGQWYGLLGLQRGDLNINFIRRLRNGKTSASSDHRAIITGLGYSQKYFYWQFEYIRHHYQRDLSQLASNRFLISIIEPTALQQSSTLNKSSSQFSLGFNIDAYTLSTQFNRLTSVLDNTRRDFIGLSFTLPLDNNQQLTLQLTSPLQNDAESLGLSFLQQW